MEYELVDDLSLEDYKKLLASASWKVLSDYQHQKALENSMYLSVVKVNQEVVGMARLIGDYGTHGLLADVVVLPPYQGKGLGRALVSSIQEKVYRDLKPHEQFLIELLPAYGKREFYQKCGFRYKPENMDGMYLWIKKEEEESYEDDEIR